MSNDPSKSQDRLVPTATDMAADSGPDSSAPVAGTSKASDSTWQSYMNAMEKHIEEETSPARRKNIEVVLNFVRQHGYPAQGYHFLAHHGIMEVWTDDEFPDKNEENLKLIGSTFQDTYGLHYPVEASPRERE
ncbi:hypothetical protein KVR01_004681 [Diaporthe batatas]|uniref:uncharacterized protein n=1 Tax=Diaporthe batatas TaxID=748121 RepID=UPI001D03C8DD|nr:uncharacterized protein KVR01_004681 [Diaporthe batatas]KAG8166129.1 hypothetical protein KVR01_004681 [Diaporthe batatas]